MEHVYDADADAFEIELGKALRRLNEDEYVINDVQTHVVSLDHGFNKVLYSAVILSTKPEWVKR